MQKEKKISLHLQKNVKSISCSLTNKTAVPQLCKNQRREKLGYYASYVLQSASHLHNKSQSKPNGSQIFTYISNQINNIHNSVSITEVKCFCQISENDHRIVECLKLEGTSGGYMVQPPVQAGPPGAGCPRLCLDSF